MLEKGTIRTLETARLILRPVVRDYAPQIQEKFPKWEIVRFLSYKIPWPYPNDGAIDFIENLALPLMASNQGWFWAIFPKSAPDELIGIINLVDNEEENRGFWLDLDWQGEGLMGEASEAVTDFWFFDLGKEKMRAHKAIENLASRQISINQGMRIINTQTRNYVGGEKPAETWEITRQEWEKSRSAKY